MQGLDQSMLCLKCLEGKKKINSKPNYFHSFVVIIPAALTSSLLTLLIGSEPGRSSCFWPRRAHSTRCSLARMDEKHGPCMSLAAGRSSAQHSCFMHQRALKRADPPEVSLVLKGCFPCSSGCNHSNQDGVFMYRASYRELHRGNVGVEVSAPFLTSCLSVMLFSSPQPLGEGNGEQKMSLKGLALDFAPNHFYHTLSIPQKHGLRTRGVQSLEGNTPDLVTTFPSA